MLLGKVVLVNDLINAEGTWDQNPVAGCAVSDMIEEMMCHKAASRAAVDSLVSLVCMRGNELSPAQGAAYAGSLSVSRGPYLFACQGT